MPVRSCCFLALLGFLAACPGRGELESDAVRCKDGLDNDNDGLIDCKDPGCFYLAYCNPSDARPQDGPAPPPPPLDHGPDVKPPDPDLPPSSYGKQCQFTTGHVPCDDGETECVPGNAGPGFCTYPCPNDSCPPGPTGTETDCAYKVYLSGQPFWYCIFRCSAAPCPHDTQCYGSFCY